MDVCVTVPRSTTVQTLKLDSKKQQDLINKALCILERMGDTTSVFSEFKNGETSTLLFQRNCESKYCWSNVHSKNAFIIKGTSNGWFYWCYGNECRNDGRMFRIEAINDTDNTPTDEIIEKFNNTTVSKCEVFQYLNYRVVDNIAPIML